MKVLTKNTDYAIRALMTLAQHQGEYLSSREIAAAQDIPYQYLRRIMQVLVKKNYVASKEGSGGGVRLVADPAKIKIVDIIEMFQGAIELSTCMFRGHICANRKTCVLRNEIKRIERLVTTEFEKLTIRKLVDKSNRVDGLDKRRDVVA